MLKDKVTIDVSRESDDEWVKYAVYVNGIWIDESKDVSVEDALKRAGRLAGEFIVSGDK